MSNRQKGMNFNQSSSNPLILREFQVPTCCCRFQGSDSSDLTKVPNLCRLKVVTSHIQVIQAVTFWCPRLEVTNNILKGHKSASQKGHVRRIAVGARVFGGKHLTISNQAHKNHRWGGGVDIPLFPLIRFKKSVCYFMAKWALGRGVG